MWCTCQNAMELSFFSVVVVVFCCCYIIQFRIPVVVHVASFIEHFIPVNGVVYKHLFQVCFIIVYMNEFQRTRWIMKEPMMIVMMGMRHSHVMGSRIFFLVHRKKYTRRFVYKYEKDDNKPHLYKDLQIKITELWYI